MKLLQITFFVFLISCSANEKVENKNKQHRGSIEIEELFSEYSIFKKGFDDYVPLELSKLKDDDINVVVFFGTWCHDSKRELPKALKIFNKIGINDENIELVAVGFDKKEPLGRAAKLNLMYTPTLIFFRGSKEIGRIIEKPVLTLEKDIELIISSI
jgi:thiol-disulfide isomerase/thioredoxin